MRVAVAIPCFNEAPTIAKVINDFREALPEAEILVFDNNSTDGSRDLARQAGAQVIVETRRGKGNVVRSVFNQVEADFCVLVDGDDTYVADDVHALLEPLVEERADMVVGNRLENLSGMALTDFRRLGNLFFLGLVNLLTRRSFRDILCGFRVMNRRFLKTVPLKSRGFEIETELTLRAVAREMTIREVPIGYRERPRGSHSKLSPFSDGCRILMTIAKLLIEERVPFRW